MSLAEPDAHASQFYDEQDLLTWIEADAGMNSA
jgi:hypothetical protein